MSSKARTGCRLFFLFFSFFWKAENQQQVGSMRQSSDKWTVSVLRSHTPRTREERKRKRKKILPPTLYLRLLYLLCFYCDDEFCTLVPSTYRKTNKTPGVVDPRFTQPKQRESCVHHTRSDPVRSFHSASSAHPPTRLPRAA